MGALSLDLRSLAVIRIGIACIILGDLASRARFLREHYTDAGIFPRAAIAETQGAFQWSLHLATGSAFGQTVLFVVAALCAVALLFGWQTRLFALASWALLVSLQNRAPALCYGADSMLRALLFFALFLPIGARWSVDARGSLGRLPDEHRSVAAVALTVQVGMIYLFSALLKLRDPSWTSLDAVFLALHADSFVTPFGAVVGRSFDVTRVLSALTLAIELLLPLALFVPIKRDAVRTVVIVAFLIFHAAHALTLHLGFFPLVAMLAWLTFLPASFWERVGSLTKAGVDVDRQPARAMFAAAIVVVVALVNVAGAFPSSVQAPPWALRIARAVSMEQRWAMFIRPVRDGWLVAPAQLLSGRTLDALNHGAPVSYDKPAVVADRFPDMRWRKLLTDMALDRPSSKRNAELLVVNLCNGWNDGISDSGERMISVDVVFLEERDHVDGTAEAPIRRTLAHRDCLARADRGEDDSAQFFRVKPRRTPP